MRTQSASFALSDVAIALSEVDRLVLEYVKAEGLSEDVQGSSANNGAQRALQEVKSLVEGGRARDAVQVSEHDALTGPPPPLPARRRHVPKI